MAEPLSIRCYSKINLGLQVLRSRPDGYHEIRTILHTLELHDTLEVQKGSRNSLEIAIDGPLDDSIPEDGENLVLKAADVLEEKLEGRGTAFRLTKRIPSGAGLGGGSSDAAGVLMALNHLYDLGIRPIEMHRMAAELGADVPFFLYGGAALGLGTGTEVYPLPDGPDLPLVIAFPDEGLATPEVYQAWDNSLTSPDKPYSMSDFAPWCLVLRGERPGVANDLEEAALRLRPSLKGLRTTLEASGAYAVAMTGSGSAFFGLFGNDSDANAASQRARKAGYSALRSRTLGREARDRSLLLTSESMVRTDT
jgi:4-diphosphocytidyl-2-C-methyl-D-erythritol kinase